MIPKVVKMDVYPVAGHDSMELNLSGAHAPYFTRKVIPAGTYPDQTEDCNTITCKAVLYCRADMDEETVYKITKAFYESGDEIAAAHATGKEVQLEGCLDGVTTPIHPGAAKYFKEMGIEVPDNG